MIDVNDRKEKAADGSLAIIYPSGFGFSEDFGAEEVFGIIYYHLHHVLNVQ